jgi:peroxiredoxin (alkyl hydroperoxide reductase subunit C)
MADGIVRPGAPAPTFRLTDELGEDFTNESIKGQTAVFVFYPFAFSPVCTDQFQVYEEVLGEFEEQGAKLYGVSCDAMWSQKAFKDKLGITIPMLSDFEPKGAASKAFGAYFEPGGFSNRALVIINPEGVVRYSHLAANPGELPGANLIFDALSQHA